nr:interferon gamma receptor 1-like [Nerophis lumbriciformis]
MDMRTTAVPPPSNLTITCHNTTVIAHWDFFGNEPDGFLVSMEKEWEIPAQRRYANLSDTVWKSLDSALAVHELTVVAKASSGRRSKNTSVAFTYSDERMATIKCKLDFPPVDVKAIEEGVAVSFRNPLHYYTRLWRAPWRQDISLHFIVKSDTARKDTSCRNEDSTCKVDVTLTPGSAKCVTVEGSMESLMGRPVVFSASPRICAEATSNLNLMPLIVVVLLLLLVILVVALYKVRLYIKKAEKPQLPKCLHPNYGVNSLISRSYRTDIRHVADADNRRVPLISTGDEKSSGVSTEIESLQFSLDDQEEEVQILKVEIHGEDEEVPIPEVEEEVQEEDEKEEEPPVSNYDSRHVHMTVNMGDELALGYAEG